MFVKNIKNALEVLKQIGCDDGGFRILRDKIQTYSFLIEDLKTPAAHILKQEALACGGDFALPKDAILYKRDSYNGVLLITKSQSKALIKKLKMQDFGLKNLALILETHFKNISFEVQIMGVANITTDSFYPLSRKAGDSGDDYINAINSIIAMIEDGASIIDIGAASSRPGSSLIKPKDELEKLEPLLKIIRSENLYTRASFSIDTYNAEVAKKCLDSGFKIVNDITGFRGIKMIEAVKGYDCRCVIMHMQGNPQDMQDNPTYENLFLEIDSFFKNQIDSLESAGIKDIILDVGIGFGKSLEHNCELIRNLRHFSHFGYPLLVGASRKSMIDKIYKSDVFSRLPGTLAIHLESINNGASIIRCHDVREHIQAIKALEALK